MGTVFGKVINDAGFSNVQIVNYNSTPQLIDALSDGSVDFILQDALSAQYWSFKFRFLLHLENRFPLGMDLPSQSIRMIKNY